MKSLKQYTRDKNRPAEIIIIINESVFSLSLVKGLLSTLKSIIFFEPLTQCLSGTCTMTEDEELYSLRAVSESQVEAFQKYIFVLLMFIIVFTSAHFNLFKSLLIHYTLSEQIRSGLIVFFKIKIQAQSLHWHMRRHNPYPVFKGCEVWNVMRIDDLGESTGMRPCLQTHRVSEKFLFALL